MNYLRINYDQVIFSEIIKVSGGVMWFSDHQRKSVASGEYPVSHHCFLIHPAGQRDHGTAYDAGDHQVLPTVHDESILLYLSGPSEE